MPLYMSADMYYLLLVVPAMIFAFIAQMKVSSAFKKYSEVFAGSGITGAQAAAEVLRMNNVGNVNIEYIEGKLNDHFDPRTNTIRLSSAVYGSGGIAAIGVAAHEAGHAVQYAVGYGPVKFRSAIIPITQIGSNLSWPLILFGLVFNMFSLFVLGIVFFAVCAFFQLVTLPVEFNASSRAIEALEKGRMLDSGELNGAKKVLSAAAMTYVAALAVSLAQLLRFVIIAMSGRRRN